MPGRGQLSGIGDFVPLARPVIEIPGYAPAIKIIPQVGRLDRDIDNVRPERADAFTPRVPDARIDHAVAVLCPKLPGQSLRGVVVRGLQTMRRRRPPEIMKLSGDSPLKDAVILGTRV